MFVIKLQMGKKKKKHVQCREGRGFILLCQRNDLNQATITNVNKNSGGKVVLDCL